MNDIIDSALILFGFCVILAAVQLALFLLYCAIVSRFTNIRKKKP